MDIDARRTIARLTAETLPRLIERLARSELGELEVRDDGWRIRLRRANGIDGQAGQASSRTVPAVASAEAGDRAHAVRHSGASRRPEHRRGLVTSPAVGYYVALNGLAVGAAVRKGDVIGHVDVLGVRHEVVAPLDGALAALEVESGQAIEYGQPIARVEQAATPETSHEDAAGNDSGQGAAVQVAQPAEPAQPALEQLVEA